MIAKKVCASQKLVKNKILAKEVHAWSTCQYKLWKQLNKVDEYTSYYPKPDRTKEYIVNLKEQFKKLKKL